MSGRNPYSRKFFAHLRITASARALVPVILDIYPARSMVDVGCGIGCWVKAFAERGVAHGVGIDGTYVDRKQILIGENQFIAHDLNLEFDVAGLDGRYGDKNTGRFDLAISPEVAEFLEPARSDGLIDDLCELADGVLFAAAVPFQGAAGHLNERRQPWWAQKFADNGYDPFDVLRRGIWAMPGIDWWYEQSTVKGNSAANAWFVKRFANLSDTMFDIIHPELFREKVNRLKNGSIVQKLLNRSRQSAGEPRRNALETPLYGDERGGGNAKTKSGL